MNKKRVGLLLKIIIIIALLFNDNNNPMILGDRILNFIIPIEGKISLLLIINIGSYFVLRELNGIKESFFTKSFFRRVLTVIIVIPIIQSLWIYPTKFIKRFEKGLDTVYLYRDNTKFKAIGNSEVVLLEGWLKLENLGKKEQRFYVKVNLPTLMNSEKQYLKLKEEYVIKPKESIYIKVNEEVSSYLKNGEGFEINGVDNIFIFNEEEEEEVVFKDR